MSLTIANPREPTTKKSTNNKFSPEGVYFLQLHGISNNKIKQNFRMHLTRLCNHIILQGGNIIQCVRGLGFESWFGHLGMCTQGSTPAYSPGS